jgi:micrococcal nuclease
MATRTYRVLAVVALLALAGCTVNVSLGDGGDPAQSRTATVTEVVDGDTIDVRFADGSEERVRLLGVDTPEVYAETSAGEFEGVPDTDRGRECLREWGERASAFAERELAGATVTVRTDTEADRRGGYGRLLAYVTVDGSDESFNYALLTDGYARLYDSPFSRLHAYEDAERAAQRNGTGLWACAS